MSTDHQDLRERIAATLTAHDLPDGTDRDGQWAADALMPLITAEIGRLEAEIDRADLRADRRAADLRTQKAAVAARDSRITELESRLARSQTHRADLTRKNSHLQALADRRWVAYQSARQRAQAYGEGTIRHVEERNWALGWLKAADRRAAELDQELAAATRPHRAEDIQVWPLARVLSDARCGSQDWTWDEEWDDLDERHAETGYLDKLEQQIRANGITMPVLIGSDGRLWDGHHRLRIAVRAGIPYVPVEVVPRATTAPPRADARRATSCGCGHSHASHWGESASGHTECMASERCPCGGSDVSRGPRSPEALADTATELTRHDQAHGHYDTTTAPTHGGHDE